MANDQRRVIYQQRTDLMGAEDVAEAIKGIREDVVAQLVEQYLPGGAPEEQWDAPGLAHSLERDFGVSLPVDWMNTERLANEKSLPGQITSGLEAAYAQKGTEYWPAGDALHRKRSDAAYLGSALARASGGDGLYAARYLSAQLCAEESQTGIQARSL